MPPDDKIAKVLSSDKTLFAKISIDKRHHLAIRDSKAPIHGLGPACFWPSVATSAGIHRLVLACVRRLQGPQDVLTRTLAGVHHALGFQCFKSALVK